MGNQNKKYTNDYFLEFSTADDAVITSERINHTDIPEGYSIYHYKDVYIPVDKQGETYARGSGTNPETREVPVYYRANSDGLRRAITFLQAIARQLPTSAELAAERARNLRVHLLPDGSKVAENESSEIRSSDMQAFVSRVSTNVLKSHPFSGKDESFL